MRLETVDIAGRPLRAYLPDATERSYYRGKRPALLIFPGGGYAFTYEGEAEPIALRFAAEGIAAFVLDYTCTDSAPQAFPRAVREAFAAVLHIRLHAEEYGIDAGNIAVCGFSAGGHLCACTGTLWNKPEAEREAFFAPGMARACRPDKLVLCYPVIRGQAPCHNGSFCNFFGEEQPAEAQLAAYSLQNRVDAETPPTFLWATAEDDAVPVAGALEFAAALSANRVPFELHVWPHGGHGLCLGNQVTQAIPFGSAHDVAAWTQAATRFLYTVPEKS